MSTATVNDLLHYAGNLLSLVYPLDRSDYIQNSLARRASYNYMQQIVEGTDGCIRRALGQLIGKRDYVSKGDCVRAAERAQLLSASLAQLLLNLIPKRNDLTHENPEFDANLEGFGLVFDYVIAAYAVVDTLATLDFFTAQPNRPLPARASMVQIGRDYVLDRLSKIGMETDILAKATAKLERERSVRTVELLPGVIARLAQRDNRVS